MLIFRIFKYHVVNGYVSKTFFQSCRALLQCNNILRIITHLKKVILLQDDLTGAPPINIYFCNNTQNKHWVLRKIKEKPT